MEVSLISSKFSSMEKKRQWHLWNKIDINTFLTYFPFSNKGATTAYHCIINSYICMYTIFNCLYLTLLCGYKISRFKNRHAKRINNHIITSNQITEIVQPDNSSSFHSYFFMFQFLNFKCITSSLLLIWQITSHFLIELQITSKYFISCQQFLGIRFFYFCFLGPL